MPDTHHRPPSRPAQPTDTWTCVPPDSPAAGVITPILASRLVTAFSQPDQTILTAGLAASLLAETAVDMDRCAVIDPIAAPRVFPPLGSLRANLILLSPPAVSSEPQRYRRLSQAIEPGGVLVAVAPVPGSRPPTEAIADAATAAGLSYVRRVLITAARGRGHSMSGWPTTSRQGQSERVSVFAVALVFCRTLGDPAKTREVGR